MSDWAGLAWLFVLLAGNAFFVGAEFAVISARRSQVEPLAEQGRRSAKTALWAMEHATLMLAMSQLGITICSLLILNVSEPAIHHLLAEPLGLTGLAEGTVDVIAFIIALLLLSHRKASGASWNWVAAATHLLLGSANLLFWPSFASYGLETMGVVATGMHAVLFALQTITALARSPAGRA